MTNTNCLPGLDEERWCAAHSTGETSIVLVGAGLVESGS